MSQTNPVLIENLTASGAITARRIVKISGDNTVAQASAATDAMCGVALLAAAASGDPVPVGTLGVFEVEAGAAIVAGATLMCDASGRVITAATAANRVIGQAREAASAAGEFISCFLCSVPTIL